MGTVLLLTQCTGEVPTLPCRTVLLLDDTQQSYYTGGCRQQVLVKTSVGTDTEKFWDSLWELQAECTGLLWVERHPWARGDLGQSARRGRKTEDRFGHKQ
ncbi:hypothetical protein EYF80_009678 [Liparis tanakae]|uniref:Uncharacterized protein n=1 Tax=Liparis tanakae TaxID=230148 RepID=A0A4Z2IPY8_9TELE|nr:hypothetical protein EYF80_009678 [Liparis tanakae]